MATDNPSGKHFYSSYNGVCMLMANALLFISDSRLHSYNHPTYRWHDYTIITLATSDLCVPGPNYTINIWLRFCDAEKRPDGPAASVLAVNINSQQQHQLDQVHCTHICR